MPSDPYSALRVPVSKWPASGMTRPDGHGWIHRGQSPQISELARATTIGQRGGAAILGDPHGVSAFLGQAVLADAKALAWFGSAEARGISVGLFVWQVFDVDSFVSKAAYA